MKDFSSNSRKQYFTLDLLRVFAILCVILVHTTERVYQINLEAMPFYTVQRQWFALTLFTIGRMGVPIFLFLTGYLFLGRRFDKEYTALFYKRNLLGLLITVEIWIILYHVFNAWFYQIPFNLNELLHNMLFLKATNMSHMWYIPAILGIYLFIPFVSRALSSWGVELSANGWILWVVIFYLYILPEINIILQCNGKELFAALPSLDFSGGAYGFPLILGFLTQQKYFRRFPTILWAFIGSLCLICTVWLQFYSYEKGVGYNVWYNNATLLIACLATFECITRCEDADHQSQYKSALIMKLRSSMFGKAVQSLARCSFGIYLIHNPINMLLIRFFFTESAVLRLAITGIITVLCSWGTVWALCKNRYVAKILFNCK